MSINWASTFSHRARGPREDASTQPQGTSGGSGDAAGKPTQAGPADNPRLPDRADLPVDRWLTALTPVVAASREVALRSEVSGACTGQAALPGDNAVPFFPYETGIFDVEVAPEGYAIFQGRLFFYFAELDPVTGTLDKIVNAVPFTPASLAVTFQGPEFVRTAEGLSAVGTSVAGLVLYDATSGALLPDTSGLILGGTPFFAELAAPKFAAYPYTTREPFIYDDGDRVPLPASGEARSWVSSTEILFQYWWGYSVFDIESGESTLVSAGLFPSKIHSSGFTSQDGTGYVVLYAGAKSKLFVRTDEDWSLHRVLTSPYEGYKFLWSPEFIEWNERIFIAGYFNDLDSWNTLATLYDIQNDEWIQITAGDNYVFDPEAVELASGDLAYYFAQEVAGEFRQYVTTLPADAVAADVNVVDASTSPNALVGTGHADALHGSSGRDTIFALEGDDVIDGGPGRDRLFGGPGDDTFVVADPSVPDLIFAFEAGADRIEAPGIGHEDLSVVTRDGDAVLEADALVTTPTINVIVDGAGLTLDELTGAPDVLLT